MRQFHCFLVRQMTRQRRMFASSSYKGETGSTTGITVQEAKLPQAPNNRTSTWSENQAPRSVAMSGPRFEQTNLSAQPQPPAAIEMIAAQPVILVSGRQAVCDGGGGALGHPKVYLNLDNHSSSATCGYCGLQFQQKNH